MKGLNLIRSTGGGRNIQMYGKFIYACRRTMYLLSALSARGGEICRCSWKRFVEEEKRWIGRAGGTRSLRRSARGLITHAIFRAFVRAGKSSAFTIDIIQQLKSRGLFFGPITRMEEGELRHSKVTYDRGINYPARADLPFFREPKKSISK